jgi:hypothetical protein
MIHQTEKIQRVGIMGFLFDEFFAEVLRFFVISRLVLASSFTEIFFWARQPVGPIYTVRRLGYSKHSRARPVMPFSETIF